MIFTERVITDDNEMMDEVISSSETSPQDVRKSPRGSAVRELWRKREGSIRSINSKNLNTRRGELIVNESEEENGKGNHETIASKRNELELTVEEVIDNDDNNDHNNKKDNAVGKKRAIAVAPRRSTVRDSWKKIAASTPKTRANPPNNNPRSPVISNGTDSAPNSSSSNIERQSLHNNLADGDIPLPQSTNENHDEEGSCDSPAINATGWNSKEKQIEQDVREGSSRSYSSAGHNSCAREIISNSTSPSAFNELKSKWAQFGVQQQAQTSPEKVITYKTNANIESFLKKASTESTSLEISPSSIKLFPKKSPDDYSAESAKDKEEITLSNTFERKKLLKFDPTTSKSTQSYNTRKYNSPEKRTHRSTGSDSTKETYSSSVSSGESNDLSYGCHSGLNTMSSSLASRRKKLDSKTLRSKYTRRQTNRSVVASVNKDSGIDTAPEKSSTIALTSTKDLVPTFSHDGDSTEISPPKIKEAVKNTDSQKSPDTIGKCSSRDASTTTQNPEYANNFSSLTSRASRKLRNIRQRQQQARNNDHESSDKSRRKTLSGEIQESNPIPLSSKESNTNPLSVSHNKTNLTFDVQTPKILDSPPPADTATIRRTRENTSYRSTLVSTDAVVLSPNPSLCSETDTITGESKNSRKSSPLHGVVPDANKMIPEEFVSEKNTNVESFQSAYNRTTLKDIAKDMTDEASSVLGMDDFNQIMQDAFNKIPFGDLFHLPSKKIIKRVPSPVEEVAIEVEYVADSD